MSRGNSADLSISAARGATRSRASVRTSSRISRCSSVSGSAGTGGSLVPVVAHDLDIVAVRVEHERAVVAGVIVPLARRTVVAVARRDERSVELVHDRVVGGREGEVHVLGQRPVVVDDAERPVLAPEMPPFWPLAREDEAAEGTDGLVEALRGLEVGDPDPEMVDAVVAFARA